MAKAKQPDEQFVTLTFPLAGVNTSTPFAEQAQLTTALGTNVRSFEPQARRQRGGSRPGLVKYIADPVVAADSPVQWLTFIVDPQAPALLADDTVIWSPDGPPFPSGGGSGGYGGILDPSTNNLQTRNPGRYVRIGGSGRQPKKGDAPPQRYYYLTGYNVGDGNVRIDVKTIGGTSSSIFIFNNLDQYVAEVMNRNVNKWILVSNPDGEDPSFPPNTPPPQPKPPSGSITFTPSAVTQTTATLTWAPGAGSGGLIATIIVNEQTLASSPDSPYALTDLTAGTSYPVFGYNTSVTFDVDPTVSQSSTSQVGTLLTLPEVFDFPVCGEITTSSFTASVQPVPEGCDRVFFRLYADDFTTILDEVEVNPGSAYTFTGLPSLTLFGVAASTGNATGYANYGDLSVVGTV
jgi:hypothetical protein